MTLPPPIYDLVLLLDPRAEPPARAKIVADTRTAIEGQGELLRHDEWGERPLTYPIEKQTSAEYHLLQFHAPSSELMSGVERTLKITDGVLRFRIIKLKPGVPDPPDMGSATARREAEADAPPPAAAAPPAPAPATQVPEVPESEAPASPAEAPAADAPSPSGDAPAPGESAEPADEPAVAESA